MNDEILIHANNMVNALNSLELFAYSNFGSLDGITLKSVNQLHGQVAALVALAEKTVADIEKILNV